MNEEYKKTIGQCLFYLKNVRNTLVDNALEVIQCGKENCTQGEQMQLRGFQARINEVVDIIDDLSNDMDWVLTDEILKGVMGFKCTNI